MDTYRNQTTSELRETRALIVFLGTPDPYQKIYDAEQLAIINAELARRGPDYGTASLDELLQIAKDRYGLGTYDTALPHDWCVDVQAKTGEWPFGFVWAYEPKSIWGEPFALTFEARELLARYEAARG